MQRTSGKLACLSAAVSAIFATSAGAQEPPNSSAAGASKRTDQIETITVTAQKRKEDASKIPLSISVLSGDDLAAQHIVDMSDITRAIPNVSFSGASGSGAGLSNIEIRGVSSSAGSSTVGVYLDDVSLTTRNLYSLGSAEPKLFDLDHIEVLRGPQGTLYGASSMGGTIKFLTNQPNLKARETNLSAEVSSTRGGGTNYTVNGVFNLPVVANEMALRIGLQKGHEGGYIDQVDASGARIARGINSEDSSVARLALKWTPTKNFSLTPSMFYQEVKSADIDASYTSLPKNQTSKTVREPGKDTLYIPSLTVNYDMGFADLVSVSSYYQRDFNRTQDGTTVNSSYIGGLISASPGAPPGLGDTVAVLPSAVLLENAVRQFSQEVRLTSKAYDPKGNSPFTWNGGVYFSSLRTNVVDNEPVYGINQAFANAGQNLANGDILGFPFPNDNSYYSARHYKTRQTALFGETSYYFTPSLNATVGARYLRATDSLTREGDFFFANGPASSAASSDFHAFTPKFAVSWQVDPTNTVYASATQGFRLGGQNRAVPASVCASDFANLGITEAPTSFDSDKLWSYEVGSKSRLLGNRMSLNLAAFYVDWNRLQQDIPLPGCGFDYETNVGKAKSYGVEIETKFKPTSSLVFGFAGGYTKATLSSDVPTLGALAGDPIQGVPKYNASLTAQYNFSFNDDTYGFARAASHWIGASHGSLIRTDPDYQRPSYNTVDASFGASRGDWELALFAKNLFDTDKVIQTPNVQSINEGYRVRPRTIGITLSGKI